MTCRHGVAASSHSRCKCHQVSLQVRLDELSLLIFCHCVLCKDILHFKHKVHQIQLCLFCDEVTPARPVAPPAHSHPRRSALSFLTHLCCCAALPLLSSSYSSCSPLCADIDMKKDIETLIAEERADIILKYATVSLCFQHIRDNSPSVLYDGSPMGFDQHAVQH